MSMAMKRIIYILSSISLCLTACSGFDDMNKNPYVMYDSEAQAQVQTIVYNTEYGLVGSAQALVGELMQYTVNTDTEITANMAYNYSISESATVRIWQRLYVQAGNAEYMLAKAREEGNPTMIGVALALRAFIYTNIADTYGNVPYYDACNLVFQKDNLTYVTTYDDMESIYKDIFLTLEQANESFNVEGATDFDPICDYMYDGSKDKWQRFSNTLYLRLLMRVALKVEEQYGGVLPLNDEVSLDVKAKIAELWECFNGRADSYPMMRNASDAAVVEFSTTDAALVTPFYTTTQGTWTAQKICRTLMEKLYDKTKGLEDPRWRYYSTRNKGCPPQYEKTALDVWMSENTGIGRLPYGAADAKYNIQNCDHYAMLNYSEVLFIFAEAAVREYITLSFPDIRQLYLDAIAASVMEWNKEISAGSDQMKDFLAIHENEIKVDNSLEKIMEQKWISMFFVGIESWCDYRRTGYPVLVTNGPAAENFEILPTRMRYPADEAYRNMESFAAAVNGWLGGENNMTTEVWWAETKVSVNKRKEGRK
ncbi:MAG: SusD/RagB family nutrient-binding outer membrane lipoprotein [Bacteroidales bacterium]|nr:SusD/RagB family nutrient-binding outer membrane lipoprotein [Bacteroidales bacterium]